MNYHSGLVGNDMTEVSADFSHTTSVPWIPAILTVIVVLGFIGVSSMASEWLDSHCELGGYITWSGIQCVVSK